MKYVQVKDLILKEGNPKICVPLTGINSFQILDDLEILRFIDFDLVELRIDYYENVEDFANVIDLLNNIRKHFTKPIIFTFRTKGEGGMHEMTEEKYFSLNQHVIKSGLVDLIDIEMLRSEEKIKDTIYLAKKYGVKVIMSKHDFHKTPAKEEIVSTLVKMQEYDADITKIAVMPNCEEDVLNLIGATVEMKKSKGDRPFITMAMGSLGVITRLTGSLFGSCLTFAALNNASAPGQINVRNARELLNLLQI